MTQLLLFDAPAHSPFPVSAESPDRPAERSEQEVKRPRRMKAFENEAEQRRERLSSPRVAAEESAPRQGGMHHMGDLASLVIARYELVAKRRAALLARGPLPSVRF